MVLVYPALHLMIHGSPAMFALGQVLLAVPLGMALGLHGAILVEIFPLRSRVTSMSFAYSVTLALAGGTAPLVSTWLIERFDNPLAPAWYIMAYGAIGLVLIGTMKETNSRALDE
jgi:MHS family proline/betaine transporter-like MFS transporter